MNDFLPPNYEQPNSGGGYMKFQKGENRFRFISSPITGWEWWTDGPEGEREVWRRPMGEGKPESKLQPKHFWAAVVYDYQAKTVKILEITQKSIQTTILALNADPDWGNPKEYDLCVTKTGEGLETEYLVTPKPKSPIPESAIEAAQKIKLEALFSGDDPFNFSN